MLLNLNVNACLSHLIPLSSNHSTPPHAPVPEALLLGLVG